MALFDLLLSNSSHDENQTACEIASIKTHLDRLLNARQGSLAHLPNYGLPDVSAIYRGMPYTVHDLAKAVKQCIETFEPRLLNVWVTPIAAKQHDCIIQLEISASLITGTPIQFHTYFKSAGNAHVSTV